MSEGEWDRESSPRWTNKIWRGEESGGSVSQGDRDELMGLGLGFTTLQKSIDSGMNRERDALGYTRC